MGKLLFGAVALGTVAWLLWRPTTSSKRLPKLKPGTRILVLGDSYAVGLAPYLGELAKAGGYAFRGVGCPPGSTGGAACSAVVGSSVTQWAQDKWLVPNLDAIQPTLVIVSLGGNDFQRTDPTNVQTAISVLVQKLRARGAEIVWINPLPLPFPDKIGVRDMWKAVGVPYFDGETLEYPRAPDRIHLNPSGYKDWAARIWQEFPQGS